MQKILDVGCGLNKTEGSIGIDFVALPEVDVIWNLNTFPWPFENETFDEIIFNHSITHLDDIVGVMNEIHRISKPGAKVVIVTPHFSSDNMFTDPTMKFFMGIRSMDYFSNTNSTLSKKYGYYIKTRFNIEFKKIYFYKSDLKNPVDKILNVLFRPFDVIFNRIPRIYEKYLAFIFRANELKFVLRVIK